MFAEFIIALLQKKDKNFKYNVYTQHRYTLYCITFSMSVCFMPLDVRML